jgi:hypothetical protein
MDTKSLKTDNSKRPFDRVHLHTTAPDLTRLHKYVLRQGKRVELVDETGGATVLISGSELEALETALELLGQTEDVRALHIEVARLAASMNPV